MAKERELSKEARENQLLKRKLAVIAAIDNIRDNIPEPTKMRRAIAEMLVKEFGTANKILGCIIGLADPSGKLAVDTIIACTGLHKCDADYAQELMIAGKELAEKKNGAAIGIIKFSLQTMSILIRLKGETLGIVVLLGIFAFSKDDLEVLKAAGSMIDSAIIQGREFHRLQQKEKVIEAIRKIDEIRDRHLPFDKMLAKVVREIHKIIPGEDSAILLYNASKAIIEFSVATNPKLLNKNPQKKILLHLAENALEDRELKNWTGKGIKVHSIICLPLILEDRKIGVIAAINRKDDIRFNQDDEELLRAIGSMMDTAIFEGMESAKIRAAFSRSVSPKVMNFMLQDPIANLVIPKRHPVTVLFADLRGSTALAEKTDPEILADFLNQYLENLARVVTDNDGTIDKFVGDEVMALFNVPLDQADHQLLAIKTALAMQKAHQKLLDKWAERKIINPIGIGIATGIPVTGEFGCEFRSDYTAIGRTPNLGARLCGKAQGGQILICPDTYKFVKNRIKAIPIDGFTFKGISEIIKVYSVTGLR